MKSCCGIRSEFGSTHRTGHSPASVSTSRFAIRTTTSRIIGRTSHCQVGSRAERRRKPDERCRIRFLLYSRFTSEFHMGVTRPTGFTQDLAFPRNGYLDRCCKVQEGRLSVECLRLRPAHITVKSVTGSRLCPQGSRESQ